MKEKEAEEAEREESKFIFLKVKFPVRKSKRMSKLEVK